MGIIAGIVILLVLLSAAAKAPKSNLPITPRSDLTLTPRSFQFFAPVIPQRRLVRRITGYKLKRDFFYGQLKEIGNYTDQDMHLMGFQEYTVEPEYDWIWVPE